MTGDTWEPGCHNFCYYSPHPASTRHILDQPVDVLSALEALYPLVHHHHRVQGTRLAGPGHPWPLRHQPGVGAGSIAGTGAGAGYIAGAGAGSVAGAVAGAGYIAGECAGYIAGAGAGNIAGAGAGYIAGAGAE